MLKNISLKPIIIYKLLKNILITFLIVWSLAILGEAFLPEFISAHVSFLKLTLLVFGLVFALYVLSQKIELQKSTTEGDNRAVLFGSVIFTIIIFGLALLKFNYFVNVTIILTTLLILFYLYKELFGHES